MTSTSQTFTLLHLTKLTNRGNQHLSPILLLLIVNRFMVSQCAPMTDIEHCWRCDDFNRQSKGQCATDYTDCGDCKQGFIQDEEDLRLCYAIEILEDPGKDIEQRTGSEVILSCIFNAKVWCVWTKNTNQVTIDSDSRYQYITADDGKSKTYDCSIRIKHLSMDDIGQWQCQSRADGNIDSVKGRSTQISIELDDSILIPTINFNDGNVSGGEIDVDDLQAIARRKRGFIRQNNVLECEVRLTPSELRWEIDGNVIVGGKLNDKRIQLNRNHLETVEYVSPLIKLTCLVEYDSGQRFTSYVVIRNGHEQDFNTQSSDVLIEDSVNGYGSIYGKPIRFSIVVTSILLSSMLLTFLITLTVIFYKVNQLRYGGRQSGIIDD